MFKRLLSNLPFNPSLIDQVSFYSKRIHHEAAVRRLGFIALILAIFVQLFAVVSPPQPSLALSSGDLVAGGFSDQAKAINYCRQNEAGYHDILDNFKISCEDIGKATTKEIRADDESGQLYFVGRKPVGEKDPSTGITTDEFTTTVNERNYYSRKLVSWQKDKHKTYKVLEGTNSDGKTFRILYNCGDIVVTKPPQPAPDPEDKCPSVPGLQTKLEQCDVCPDQSGVQKSLKDCRPCPEAQTSIDTVACLKFKKIAKNLSNNSKDANNTTAKPGDTVEYILTAYNSSKKSVEGYTLAENVGDILEYAVLVDTHGATLNSGNILRWPAENVAGGTDFVKTFTVRIKNPIPSTPVSTSDPNSYNLIMTNVFGNTINIKLPADVTKQTEAAVTTLPDTGPGSTIVVGFVLATIVGYFLARNRLLGKELDIVRHEFTSSGGY